MVLWVGIQDHEPCVRVPGHLVNEADVDELPGKEHEVEVADGVAHALRKARLREIDRERLRLNAVLASRAIEGGQVRGGGIVAPGRRARHDERDASRPSSGGS